MSVSRILYSLLLYLIFPLVIFRLFWRSRSNPDYRYRISERLGFVPRYLLSENNKPIIWVHAVSVGETIAVKPLVGSLLDKYPDHQILITTTTPTGSDMVNKQFDDRVEHVYFPYDLPDVITRFVNRINPKIVVIVETEIWPNLYDKLNKEEIPLVLINARLSEKSTRKYLKFNNLIAETILKVNTICVRSEVDAKRFKQLGATEQQLVITGNIKFDVDVIKQQVAQGKQWRKQWQSRDSRKLLVWVAASTHAGEDEIILMIYQNLLKQLPTLKLVLIPRHPERFDDVFRLCNSLKAKGINTLRHSQNENHTSKQSHIILGDSMGEMQSWFATADVVFMGGSLVETGGHNPLEAIALGVPVVSGPYMYNFDDVNSSLIEAGLLSICGTSDELEEKVCGLLKNETLGFYGSAKNFMQQHQGVTARLVNQLSKWL